jgi:hypothetical protein
MYLRLGCRHEPGPPFPKLYADYATEYARGSFDAELPTMMWPKVPDTALKVSG